MSAPVRHPAVAGQFYPSHPDQLRLQIDSFVQPVAEKIRALGCVVPHAGYIYSGHVAGAVYSRLELPRRFVILCPNHTGAGHPLAIVSRGCWLTPLGEVAVDEELAKQLKQEFALLEDDNVAHAREHALEVQLPFLQHVLHEFTFVPIVVGISRLEVLTEFGLSLARVLKPRAVEGTAETKPDVLIIASSDMNHYEDDQRTRIKDRMAIDRVLALDPEGLWKTVQREQISMCGYAPAVAMLAAAKALGASKAELVKYATSADISGDRSRVVGYAGMIVS